MWETLWGMWSWGFYPKLGCSQRVLSRAVVQEQNLSRPSSNGSLAECFRKPHIWQGNMFQVRWNRGSNAALSLSWAGGGRCQGTSSESKLQSKVVYSNIQYTYTVYPFIPFHTFSTFFHLFPSVHVLMSVPSFHSLQKHIMNTSFIID